MAFLIINVRIDILRVFNVFWLIFVVCNWTESLKEILWTQFCAKYLKGYFEQGFYAKFHNWFFCMSRALNPIWRGGANSSPLKDFFSIASQVLPIWFWNFASFLNFYPWVFCKKIFFQKFSVFADISILKIATNFFSIKYRKFLKFQS